MDKIRKVLFTCFCLGFLSVIAICTMLKIDTNVSLYGVVNEVAFPQVDRKSIWTGEYQAQVDAWYKNNFPMRSLLVRANNQLLYMLGANINDVIIVGKDGCFFSEEYATAALTEVTSQNEASIVAYAEKVKLLKEKIEKADKQLVYIITPSKAEMCSEEMPVRYQILCERRPDIYNNFDCLKEELSKQGIPFIDMVSVLNEQGGDIPFFSKTGIHWNYYAAALGAKTIVNMVDKDAEVNIHIAESETPLGTEQDVYLLANLIIGKKDDTYYMAEVECTNSEKLKSLKLLEMGTSFSGELEREFFPQGISMWNQFVRYQYFAGKNVSKGTMGNYQTGDFYNEQLRMDVANADIIMIENNNSYVPESHYRFVDFILSMSDDELKTADILTLENEFSIDFSAQGNGDEYVWRGFYDEEETGRWAMPEAEMCVELQVTGNISLDLSNCSFAPNTKVLFNDAIIWQSEQGEDSLADIKIPYEIINNGQENYILIVTDEEIKSPLEKGEGVDSRIMAHWINKMIFRNEKEGA